MTEVRALTLALCLAGLLAGCGNLEYKQEIEVVHSDQKGIAIRAGSDTNPDQVATLYCQGMHKLMVPKGADVIDTYKKTYYYACL